MSQNKNNEEQVKLHHHVIAWSFIVAVAAILVWVGSSQSAVEGILVQFSGTDGCVSEDGTGGECADGRALLGISSVAEPDESSGHHVYVASSGSNAVAAFYRANSSGVLAQFSGTDGCVSEDGTGGECADGKALVGASFIAASHDGRSIYVASPGSDAVAVFARNRGAAGTIAQLSGTNGCVSEDGTGGECANGKALL